MCIKETNSIYYRNNILICFTSLTNIQNTVTDEMKQSWLKNIPINKFIEPREIAEVYLMLATSKIFTGSIVTLDGGYSLLNR